MGTSPSGIGNVLILSSVLVLSCLLSGCQKDDGPQRFDVSGKATFGGMPVPVGRIRFEPDAYQGNHGPAGFATIKHGEHNTQQTGRGTVGGRQIVVIIGFDGKTDPTKEMAAGAPLFPEYRTTADLPQETTTVDFDVPNMKSK